MIIFYPCENFGQASKAYPDATSYFRIDGAYLIAHTVEDCREASEYLHETKTDGTYRWKYLLKP